MMNATEDAIGISRERNQIHIQRTELLGAKVKNTQLNEDITQSIHGKASFRCYVEPEENLGTRGRGHCFGHD